MKLSLPWKQNHTKTLLKAKKLKGKPISWINIDAKFSKILVKFSNMKNFLTL